MQSARWASFALILSLLGLGAYDGLEAPPAPERAHPQPGSWRLSSAPRPDGRFDFLPNLTLLPVDGSLVFPYLEPFGSRIKALSEASHLPAAQTQAARQAYIFSELYTQKKDNARRSSLRDAYRIEGATILCLR